MLRYLIVIALIFSGWKAQSQIPYIDSREVMKTGIELYDKGEYKASIKEYKKIHECDTNYANALYEQILALQADSSYEEAKKLAIDGLKLRKSDKRQFLLSLAATYDYLKMPDSALVLYDSVTKRFPHDHQAWYEQGVVYFRQKNYDRAQYYFKKSLLINPNHFRSNYMMALSYSMQGRLSEALIVFEASLLMTQSPELAKQSIALLSSICEQTDEVVKLYREKNEKYSHPQFDDIDQIVNSKLALNPDYKLKISLNDNIFRQSQAVMEKLKYDPNDTNFVMQYYVPLLTDIYKNDMFENYMLLLFSEFGFENVDALAKRRSKEVAEVKQVVYPYFNKIRTTRELILAKRKTAPEMYHYYPDDGLLVVGKSIDKGDEKMIVGDVEIYRNNYTLRARGHYNNQGEKDGHWTSYFESGIVAAKEFYVNGKQKDSSTSYYLNGNIERVDIRDAAGNAIAEYEYNYSGWLSTVKKKPNAKDVEETSYFSNGVKEMTVTNSGDNVKDGTYTLYYRNGKPKRQMTFHDGKQDGVYKSYYDNGQPNEEAVYVSGKLNGPYTAHYESGQLKEKSAYVNGKNDGPYEEYDEDGKLAEKGTYSGGTKSEIAKYNKAGKVYGTFSMRGNIPEAVKFMDEDGKVLYNGEERKGLYEYPIYYPNGNKSVDMKVGETGARNGRLTFYYATGVKSDEIDYKDGNYEGRAVSYYVNGKVKSDDTYTDDKKDGYHKSFYDNGTLSQEGWYKDGKRQGLWRYYGPNGKISSEAYYLDDKVDGWYKEYNINGEIRNKYLYTYGYTVGHVCYDTAGVRTDSMYCEASVKDCPCNMTHWQIKPAVTDLSYTFRCANTEGLCVAKYVTGAVRSREYFNNGSRDSLSMIYYPDGSVEAKGMFRDGDKTGKWLYYDELGELDKEENYNDQGMYNGSIKSYSCGMLHDEYNYVRGHKDGMQKYYGENGRVALELFYDDGDVVGYTYEGKDGQMLPEIKVKNGTAHIIGYYSNGQRSADIHVVQGYMRDTFSIWYSNGQLAERKSYNDLDLDGLFLRYSPEGKPQYEVPYTADEYNGVEKRYDKNGKLVISVGYYYGEQHGNTVVTDAAGKTTTYRYRYGLLTGVQ